METRICPRKHYGAVQAEGCQSSGKMPERCVVAGCSNITDIEMASLCIGFLFSLTNVQKQRRRKWIKFINRKRASGYPQSPLLFLLFILCQKILLTALPELNEGLQRNLIEDDIGVVPAHSVYAKDVSKLDMLSSQAVKYFQVPKRPPAHPFFDFFQPSGPY